MGLSTPAVPISHAVESTTAAGITHTIRKVIVNEDLRLTYEVWEPSRVAVGWTIVVLAGAAHWSAIWQWLARFLAPLGLRVIAPNVRAHGQGATLSWWRLPVGAATPQHYVGDVRLILVDARQVYGFAEGDFLLAGHSLGGLEAQLYALRWRVSALVLIASPALQQWFWMFLGAAPRLIRLMGWRGFFQSFFGRQAGADGMFRDRAHPTDDRRARATLLDATSSSEDTDALLAHLIPETARVFATFLSLALWTTLRRRYPRVRAHTRTRAALCFRDDFYFPQTLMTTTARIVRTTGIQGNDHEGLIVLDGPHDAFADQQYQDAFHRAVLALVQTAYAATHPEHPEHLEHPWSPDRPAASAPAMMEMMDGTSTATPAAVANAMTAATAPHPMVATSATRSASASVLAADPEGRK